MTKQIFLNQEGLHEEILFRTDGITATNTQFTDGKKTYNFADIVNVNTWENKSGGAIILCAGLVLLTLSIFYANGPGVFTGAIILSLSAYWLRKESQSNSHILQFKFYNDERVVLRFKRNEDSVNLLRVYYLYLLSYELSNPVFNTTATAVAN